MGKGAAEEGSVRTEPHRLPDRHAGVNPEAARRVRGRLHHPTAVPPTPDHEQLHSAQLGVTLPAYLDEEGVEIDVEDAGGHERSGGSQVSAISDRLSAIGPAAPSLRSRPIAD